MPGGGNCFCVPLQVFPASRTIFQSFLSSSAQTSGTHHADETLEDDLLFCWHCAAKQPGQGTVGMVEAITAGARALPPAARSSCMALDAFCRSVIPAASTPQALRSALAQLYPLLPRAHSGCPRKMPPPYRTLVMALTSRDCHPCLYQGDAWH